ncbi:hypothetical protein DDD_1345 [Nonlabens dokdonensis DSW-6]|uniref:Uncharacterized protein n=1 Tax=Nonlabens dokdonensis (strain DSM 17205 / KCTC 12402 / DSW-6) TaxID=592029 RepID=L7W8D2_NONDD|nr:hypothetical protein DDD_1345 [Nonlabens dokdonensis DSW-6]
MQILLLDLLLPCSYFYTCFNDLFIDRIVYNYTAFAKAEHLKINY